MTRTLVILAALMAAWGQDGPLRRSAKVYIHPMNGFGGYVHMAFREKALPIEVVARRDGAASELEGGEARESRRGRLPLLHGGQSLAKLRLLRVRSAEVVIEKSYGIGKRSGGRRGGAAAFAADFERQLRGGVEKKAAVAPSQPGIAVRVTSQPVQAELEVDGVYWGVTPTGELTRLTPGRHLIVLKKTGYERWEQSVELTAGEARVVHADLRTAVAEPGKARIAGLD